MASHRADQSRSNRDDRGGARYSAPRRDDRHDRERDREREPDRERDSYRGDRRGDRRDAGRRDERDRDRDHRRRDDRRDRDTYRRSRSPPRRERSRDRYRGDRPYGRDDRYNGRDVGRLNDGRRNSTEYGRLNDGRRNSSDYGRLNEGRRGSNSATPSADVRPASRSSNLSREDRKREEEEKQKRAEEEKRVRLQKKAEAWALKKKEQMQIDSPATVASPTTAPATPSVASPPPASNSKTATTKPKASAKSATEMKPTQVNQFRLDHSAAARPAQFKAAAAKSSGPTVASKCSSSTFKSLLLTQTEHVNGQASKTNVNVGAFGLKTKSTRDDPAPEPTKKGLLDDGENVANAGKRSLQALPDFAPLDDEAASPVDDEGNSPIGDIGDDDEAVRAQLEKRREELANEDTQMEEVPAAADASGEMMDVDDAAGAQEDDIDPLDAYMANLSEAKPSRPAFQGQAMFNDDNEPVATAVEVEDLMALTAAKKKKKNEMPKVDHDKVEYPPFRKNFYTEPAEVTAMTPEEVADLRLELDGIKVQPEPLPRPVVKWAQMGLLQPTMDVFAKLRFEKPTPIQAQAIPIIESGRNLIGIAKTGSGKTLAFGIPMVRHIIDQPPLKPSDGPIALILAPTRELAVQIVAELKVFLKPSGLHITSAYGGSPISDQIAMIKRGGIHVLCATPGRLIELLASNGGRVLNFKRITYVVLDEADRMFDMGFEPQVVKILENVRPDRQAILFSATFPKNMAALARRALMDPAEVTIGGRSVVAPEVEQVVKLIKPADKVNELVSTLGLLFMNDDNAQVLIFVERQETAEDLLYKLMKAKYNDVNTIHGAKDQTDRSEAINDFKQGKLPILIATSVAARGLDVPNLAMVFNFDCPTHLEDYVHRCGRTGRAGNKGTAITLLEKPGEERLAYYVLKALTQSGKEVMPELKDMADEYNQKIKSGEVKLFNGYGGSGLEKLDDARADAKRREKRGLRIEGEEVSDDEEELPAAKKTDAVGKDVKAEDDIPSYMKILNSSINVNKTERPAASGPSKPMTAKEKAMAAATKVDGRLSKKGMIHHGQPIDNKGPDAGLFHATVVINDFPQEARWAVTNRTNVVKILDSTGVSITSKGIYYPEGKTPAEDGEAKLYLLVEGDTENAVGTAMRELYQHLVTGVKLHNEKSTSRGATGRYKID